MEVIEHEKQKSRFKRKGNGARKAPDSRSPDNRRYSGKTEASFHRNKCLKRKWMST